LSCSFQKLECHRKIYLVEYPLERPIHDEGDGLTLCE
jgi:hypothetical protein